MRTDHYAYQRATRVAAFGLALQAGIGVALLLFGLIDDDTALRSASLYVLSGVLVWLGLMITFHQHKLERLEALEEDELAAARGGSASMFDSVAAETRVATRRLALMHKWLMPTFSLALAVALGGLAALMLRGNADIQLTGQLGWAVSITLGLALVCFIVSRFVAGMAKQLAWHNLRGGASYMVGNALVLFAVAIGIIFRFFENDSVIKAVCWGIPIFMALQAAEIILNFILNLYRPRIPGEVPRPAFDSKLLSLLATPDSLVRSINEAVNYQFGFDVTSSWGYQLLLRSFAWLVGIALVAMILLNMMVIVEPHQQAVRLRSGAIVRDEQGRERVYSSGILWKRPWPFESAAVYDVTRVRSLPLTALQRHAREVNLWSDAIDETSVGVMEKFIVGSPAVEVLDVQAVLPVESEAEAMPVDLTAEEIQESESEAAVSKSFTLITAEIILQYRIRGDESGLIDYLSFSPDTLSRGSDLTQRERALKALALEQISEHFARMTLDDVLSPGRTDLTSAVRRRIQTAFDQQRTGVEVVAVALPMIRPGDVQTAKEFEELTIAAQNRRQAIAHAERNAGVTLAHTVGNTARAAEIIAAIDEWDRLRSEHGKDAPQAIEQRTLAERLLAEGGGTAAQMIEQAETDRWITLMTERARASQMAGQLAPFKAAPRLYAQKRLMEVYALMLPSLRKFVVAVDPARVNVQADLKAIDPVLDFSSSIETKEAP